MPTVPDTSSRSASYFSGASRVHACSAAPYLGLICLLSPQLFLLVFLILLLSSLLFFLPSLRICAPCMDTDAFTQGVDCIGPLRWPFLHCNVPAC
ncbi:hypothetical protein FHY13_000558 [Xanthomonas arboricola]|nr:hypothetical protein [Xanthomonas euroxanthea]